MPIGAVQSRLGASVLDLTVDDRSFNKGIQGVVNQTKHVHKAFDAAGVKSEKLSGRISGLSKAMRLFGGVTGGIALIALTKWTEAMVNSVVEMKVLAATAGLSTRAMQEYSYASRQAGVSMSGLIDTSKELQLRIDEFVETGFGPASESFLRLGYSAEHFRNELYRTDDAMNSLVESIARIDSQEARLRLADEIFGGTGGEQMERIIRYMRDTGMSFQEIRQRAHDLGLVLDDDLVDNTRKLHAAFLELKDVIGVSFAEALLKILPPMDEVEYFIKTRIPNAINGLFGRLDEFIDKLKDLGFEWENLGRIIGQVLVGIAAIKGGLAGAKLGSAAGPWGTAIGGVVGSAGAGALTGQLYKGLTGIDVVPPEMYDVYAGIHEAVVDLKNLIAQPHKWMLDDFVSPFRDLAEQQRQGMERETLDRQSGVKVDEPFLPDKERIPAGYSVADLFLRAHVIELELRKLQRLGQPPQIPIPGVEQTTRAEREFKSQYGLSLTDVPLDYLMRGNEDIGYVRTSTGTRFHGDPSMALPYAPTEYPQPKEPSSEVPRQPTLQDFMDTFWEALQRVTARPGLDSASGALGAGADIISQSMATGGLEETFSTLEGTARFASDALAALAGDPAAQLRVVMVLLADVFKGMWEILGPLVTAIIKPLANMLKLLGKILAASIVPVYAVLAPILKLVAIVFTFLYNNVLIHVANALIGFANFIIAIANIFGAGLESLDYLKPTKVEDLGGAAAGGPEDPDEDGDGEKATFRRQRPINVYITFPGNVYAVGEGGFRELAEIITIEQEKSGRVPRS